MIEMGQCPVCLAYLPKSKMLVRGEPSWRVFVCSASCDARLGSAHMPNSDSATVRSEQWLSLPSPSAIPLDGA